MIRPFISTFIRRSPLLTHKLAFSFCAPEEVEHEIKELDRAQSFYRNSIRKININDKGRGKFTEHHLLRLTKLTENSTQLPLLFEGYYNYLGHLTPISSKTVDKMLQKTLSFDDAPLESVLEVFQNHNYLTYFPEYRITLKFIKAAEGNQEIYEKMIKMFYKSPLVKFNQAIVDELVGWLQNQNTSASVFASLVKLLTQRSNFGLISGQISPRELLKVMSEGIERRLNEEQKKPMKINSDIVDFIKKVKQTQQQSDDFFSQLAIFALSHNRRPLFYKNLTKIKSQERVQQILRKILQYPQNHSNSIFHFIEKQQPSKQLKSLIDKLTERAEVQKQQE